MNKSIYKLTIGSICVALSSFVLSLFTIKLTPELQIGFAEFPIIFSGIFLGPYYGATVGLTVDVLKMIKFGFPPSLFTLAPIALGVIPGLAAILIGKEKLFKNQFLLFVTVFIAMSARTIITSFALYFVNGSPVKAILLTLPIKFGSNLIEAGIYTIILAITLPAALSIFNNKVK